MIAKDWRHVSNEMLAPVFDRERRRWLSALQWDSADTWSEVEQARVSWGLPGLVAVDEGGRVRGSVFYLHAGNRFEIGGVTADNAAATCTLLNGVVQAAETARVEEVSCFAYEGAPALAVELARRDFAVDPFLYLSRPLSVGRDAMPAWAPRVEGSLPQSTSWLPHDLRAAADLLGRAYDSAAGKRFAPAQTPEEWERYVRNLVEHTACGVINPIVTRVIRHAGRIAALALVTTIGPGTAHVAQLAVDPALRGAGVAERLLREVFTLSARQGAAAVTLLVAGSNRPARALYEKMGFADRGSFLAATLTRAA